MYRNNLSKEDKSIITQLILGSANYYEALDDVHTLYDEIPLNVICRLIDTYSHIHKLDKLRSYGSCQSSFRNNFPYLAARLCRYTKFKAIMECRSITGLTLRESASIIDKVIRDNPNSFMAVHFQTYQKLDYSA